MTVFRLLCFWWLTIFCKMRLRSIWYLEVIKNLFFFIFVCVFEFCLRFWIWFAFSILFLLAFTQTFFFLLLLKGDNNLIFRPRLRIWIQSWKFLEVGSKFKPGFQCFTCFPKIFSLKFYFISALYIETCIMYISIFKNLK